MEREGRKPEHAPGSRIVVENAPLHDASTSCTSGGFWLHADGLIAVECRQVQRWNEGASSRAGVVRLGQDGQFEVGPP